MINGTREHRTKNSGIAKNNSLKLIELKFRRGILWSIALLVFPHSVSAQDWPQFLGPNRNGEAKNEKLLTRWGDDGPKQLWDFPCGQGFAGVAVKNDRVYLFHRIKQKDIVDCLDAKTGSTIWKSEFDAKYAGGATGDIGPRCVPLVHKDGLYCYGAAGTLRRLSLADGKEVWSKPLFQLFKANSGYFGGGSAPIIVDDTLVVIVGGRSAGIVGLDLDGNTKWTTAADTASYSSPVELTYQNKKCAACLSKYFLKIVEVSTGKVLAEQEFGKRGPTVNAASPLIVDKKLFLTAAYNIGGRMISLQSLDSIWENDSSLSSQYTTPIVHQGYLFGSSGREDFGNGELKCVRASDGKVMWSSSEPGLCHLIKVNDLALVWSVQGKLQLIQLDSTAFKSLAKAEIFASNSKSLPALSNGRLFLKSNGDRAKGKLVCLQVGS